MRIRYLLPLFCVFSTLSVSAVEISYTVPNDLLVKATLQAIAEEANVHADEITQTQVQEHGKDIIRLKAPYVHYTRVQADIYSGGCSCSTSPTLNVHVVTDKIMNTEHLTFEQRIHELVYMHLTAKKHGYETKPSELPPVPVVLPKEGDTTPPPTVTPPPTNPPAKP